MVKLKVGEYMATIIQNGNVGGIIRNGILYGGVLSEGGVSEISEIVRLTETEWNNLSTKDDNKIYLVTNNYGDMIRKQYQGSNRILRKSDILDYEFYYEDLMFPVRMAGGTTTGIGSYADYWINTGIQLNSTANRGRDWQLEFKYTYMSASTSTDLVVFGTDTSSNYNLEFYFSSNDTFFPYGSGLSGSVSGLFGKDVVVKYESGVLTVEADNEIKLSINYAPSSDDNSNTMYIGNYRNNYCINGFIEYIGFKWLDSPTPSGADGYTYDLSVDNNYTLNVVEYNNGIQTQTDSFTDSDLSNPVTFGDIIISYNIGADAFIIKPNYVDGKSVKLNNVLYSGNNEIEFISGETGLPSYAESQTYTLTGWIE